MTMSGAAAGAEIWAPQKDEAQLKTKLESSLNAQKQEAQEEPKQESKDNGGSAEGGLIELKYRDIGVIY